MPPFRSIELPSGASVDYVHLAGRSGRPVLYALPPGPQTDRAMVVEGLERWIDDFRRDGWTVLSPVAPSGGQFIRRHLPLVTEFLAAARARHSVPDGPVRLFGMSNGGISALETAARHPELFSSVTVAPGYLRSTELVSALSALPVTVFVGEHDSGWLERGRALVRALEAEGGRARLHVVRGEGHEAGLTLSYEALRARLT